MNYIDLNCFFSALGDVTGTPPDSAKIGKLMSPDFESSDKPDFPDSAKDKKKDRSSRFFGGASDPKEVKDNHKERPKLVKKLSTRSNGKEREREKEKDKEKEKTKERDREDGVFHKDIPMAGTVTNLMFTYTYTRKGGEL